MSRGWLFFDVDVVANAIWAFVLPTIAVVGDIVVCSPGLAIGAVLSACCVTFTLGWLEHVLCNRIDTDVIDGFMFHHPWNHIFQA